MNKLILPLFLLSLSFSAQAACQNKQVSIEINLTSITFDEGSEFGQASLTEEDSVIVTNLSTGESQTYNKGTFEDDGAGNFGAVILNDQGQIVLDVFHDHETWYEDGLYGFALLGEKQVPLNDINDCEWDELFVIF